MTVQSALTMLGAACQVVEATNNDARPQRDEKDHHSATEIVRDDEDDDEPCDAPRIPLVQPSAAIAQHAADLMLGLKAAHNTEEKTHASHHPIMTELVSLQDIPLHRYISAQRPTLVLPPIPMSGGILRLSPRRVVPTFHNEDKSQTKAAPVPFTSFLGRKNKRGEERIPSSSPTSVWEGAVGPITPPTLQLVAAAASSWLVPPPAHQPSTPLESHGALQQPQALAQPSPGSLSIAPPPAKRPALTRKTSSQWRHEMPQQDRQLTRDRLRRGLERTCQDDYETLLTVVAAMEEELLHIRATSQDHYFVQTMVLCDRIRAHGQQHIPEPTRDPL